MPTRRILEVAVIASILIHPVIGLVRLWAAKTMYDTDEGGFAHGVAEVVAVATQ